MKTSFIFYQLIFREKYPAVKEKCTCFYGSLKSKELFTFNEVYKIVRLAYCIYFFLLNRSEHYRSSASLAEHILPRASLILQNGIADGAPEVDRPKKAVSDAPSSLFLLHPGWCTGAGDLQSQLILPRCLCCCCSAAYETPYDSLKNAKCNAVSSEHDAISVRKKTIRYDAKLCSGMLSWKYRY